MTAPGTLELAQIACCNPAPLARYINVELFGRMLTYGAIVASGLGFWRYDMIKRERAARIAAENRAIAIQQQAAADRLQAAEELLQIAEERRQIAEERRQTAEERRQTAETHLQLMVISNKLAALLRNR